MNSVCHGMRNEWRKFAYKQEIIKGKKFELKLLELERLQKYPWYRPKMEPDTPPPT